MVLVVVLVLGLFSVGVFVVDSKIDFVGDIDCDGYFDEVLYLVLQDVVWFDVKFWVQFCVVMFMIFLIGLYLQGLFCVVLVSVVFELLDFDFKEEVGDFIGFRCLIICKGIVFDDK